MKNVIIAAIPINMLINSIKLSSINLNFKIKHAPKLNKKADKQNLPTFF